jgi:hypothetical protein
VFHSIILLSSIGAEGTHSLCSSAGVDAYLTQNPLWKPKISPNTNWSRIAVGSGLSNNRPPSGGTDSEHNEAYAPLPAVHLTKFSPSLFAIAIFVDVLLLA